MKTFFKKLNEVFVSMLEGIEKSTGADVGVIKAILNTGFICGLLFPVLKTMYEHPEYSNTQILIEHWVGYVVIFAILFIINVQWKDHKQQ